PGGRSARADGPARRRPYSSCPSRFPSQAWRRLLLCPCSRWCWCSKYCPQWSPSPWSGRPARTRRKTLLLSNSFSLSYFTARPKDDGLLLLPHSCGRFIQVFLGNGRDVIETDGNVADLQNCLAIYGFDAGRSAFEAVADLNLAAARRFALDHEIVSAVTGGGTV